MKEPVILLLAAFVAMAASIPNPRLRADLSSFEMKNENTTTTKSTTTSTTTSTSTSTSTTTSTTTQKTTTTDIYHCVQRCAEGKGKPLCDCDEPNTPMLIKPNQEIKLPVGPPPANSKMLRQINAREICDELCREGRGGKFCGCENTNSPASIVLNEALPPVLSHAMKKTVFPFGPMAIGKLPPASAHAIKNKVFPIKNTTPRPAATTTTMGCYQLCLDGYNSPLCDCLIIPFPPPASAHAIKNKVLPMKGMIAALPPSIQFPMPPAGMMRDISTTPTPTTTVTLYNCDQRCADGKGKPLCDCGVNPPAMMPPVGKMRAVPLPAKLWP
jgi:hypothetical protein